MRSTIIRMLAVSASLALLTTGCGEGAPSAEEEAELARRVLLTLDDLPSGWEVDESDDDDDGLEFTSEECEEFDAALNGDADFPGQTAEDDASFTRGAAAQGRTTFLTAGVGVAADDEAIADVIELFRDERLPRCLEEGLRNQLAKDTPAGTRISGFEVDAVDPPDIGDEGFALQASALIQGGGLRLPFVIDVEVVRQGRIGITVITVALNEPAPDAIRRDALQTMVGRAS
jgi:hypothetical protein